MTKTHNSDNELMASVKASYRTLRNRGETPEAEPNGRLYKVMASNSLFELADAIHLGRSATRLWLVKMASVLASRIEQTERKEVK